MSVRLSGDSTQETGDRRALAPWKPATFAFLVVVFTLLGSALVNASIHEGSILVAVADADGKQLEAKVTLLIEGAPRQVATRGGKALFVQVPPGVHRVQADADGYETVIREGIRVSPAREVAVDFALNPEPDQTVTITDETPLLDPSGRATGKQYHGESLNQIPRWNTFSSLFATLPGVIALGEGDRETLLFRSRGSGVGEARWFVDSFDITMSDPRLSATAAAAVRASGEISAMTGGADPLLSGSGMHVIAVAPQRSSRLQARLSLWASDGGLGASSSVPRHLRGRYGGADSSDESIEVLAGLASPVISERIWASLSLALRDLDGSETREAGSLAEGGFDEEAHSLVARLESQLTTRQSARATALFASRKDSGTNTLDGDAGGIELHHAFIPRARLILQGAISHLDETAGAERSVARGDATWSFETLPQHQFDAGFAVEESEDSLDSTRTDPEGFSFYVADVARMGNVTAVAAVRGESRREETERRELAPRVSLSWRPAGGMNALRTGFARYVDPSSRALSSVDEIHAGIEREIATGFLVSGYLVQRDFNDEAADGRWRGVELGARRRMSSGLFLDGQITYADDERERAPHWAFNFSALLQIPMAGIGVGASLHGRDGAGAVDGGRLSDSWALDLRASKAIGERHPVLISLDVFNLTNERVLLREEGFEGAAEIQRPRAIRLGVSTAF